MFVPYGSLLLLLELLARHDYDFGLHDLASSLYVLLGGGPLSVRYSITSSLYSFFFFTSRAVLLVIVPPVYAVLERFPRAVELRGASLCSL